jgi:hypothetical protein
MTISEVRTTIGKHRHPGHPGIVTDAAREEICITSLWPWNEPLGTLSGATYNMQIVPGQENSNLSLTALNFIQCVQKY